MHTLVLIYNNDTKHNGWATSPVNIRNIMVGPQVLSTLETQWLGHIMVGPQVQSTLEP